MESHIKRTSELYGSDALQKEFSILYCFSVQDLRIKFLNDSSISKGTFCLIAGIRLIDITVLWIHHF